MAAFKSKVKKGGTASCPNPLFVEWLTEWKEDAASKELKIHYTYGKALRSLKRYPIPLYSGKECKLLEGFGDKLCKMIDDRLSKYVADFGVGLSVKEIIDSHRASAVSPNPTSSKRQSSQTHSHSSSKATAVISLDSGSDDENVGVIPKQLHEKNGSVQSKSKKSLPSVCNRQYIPQKNSGAYALLIVLYRKQQENPGADTFMTKKELMSTAQPLSTTSFTIPDPGSRYTAWSSMGTLLKKGLVSRRSNPAQYRIASTGMELAQRLLLAEENISSEIHLPDFGQKRKQTSPERKSYKKARIAGSLNSDVTENDSISKRMAPVVVDPNVSMETAFAFLQQVDNPPEDEVFLPDLPNSFDDSSPKAEITEPTRDILAKDAQDSLGCKSFSFFYVNEMEEAVASKDEAVVCIDDEISVGFLVKAKYADLLMSGKQYKLDNTRSGCGEFVFAYLKDEDAPAVSTGSQPNRQPLVRTGSKLDMVTSSKETISVKPSYRSDLKALPSKPKPDEHRNQGQSNSSTAVNDNNFRQQGRVLKSRLSPTAAVGDPLKSLNAGGTESSKSQSSCTTTEELGEPDFVFPPGTFDILLYVDNQEYYRGTNYNEEMLIKELDKNGVRYKVCKLQIGDFLWVAKQRTAGGSDDASHRALVLDYIIERKRMDDLASSIIDGRFKEQKFRLRGCGISNPIYLVEDYGSMQHFSIPEDSLNQAIVNTQVQEGFFVKRTRDTKETAAYLFLMTRYLESIYKNKTLLGYQSHFKHCQEKTSGNEEKFMVFNIFNEDSSKTKALTVCEMFGKHIMQLHGLTAEKASAILDLYPTPQSLFCAYKKCVSDKERDELLANIKYGVTKRNIGKQMSRALAILYYSSGQLR